ncbi:Ferric iron ABC transporter, ATP-binding protein [Alkalibacterium sp. AK22]|uniref:ABC transporter ATP-binding protein n=1 Tax=Alkalibacterium sp. AK22 TaxID=1229520 RepID=UPI00044B57F6|nr:ABC transporter ATP-binding protein [Alkalibacterium sp. AK22]EXJ22589.1 Ferric iron ABC transporter, ATP-binding protein [Alkalibacterium sp. AK22]
MTFIHINNLTKRFGGNLAPAVNQVSFSINKGEIVSLLGPSGCGKTTALRMIAGFENPCEGTIQIDKEYIVSESSVTPAEKRGIGMVFQEHALFPHMTVAKNIMFGLKHMKRSQKIQRVKEMLELVELEDYAESVPSRLSGGQQQRVAIARALAPRPHVILLDEPFSNIDAGLREKMRYDISAILKKANATAIIVTHDQKDAFAVADKIVVMKEGMIQQVSTPKELYRCPSNCFVAQFVGKTNLLQGIVDSTGTGIETSVGTFDQMPAVLQSPHSKVMLSIRPENISVSETGRYSGFVDRIVYGGDSQEIHLTAEGHRGLAPTPLLINAPISFDIEVNEQVRFDISSNDITVIE